MKRIAIVILLTSFSRFSAFSQVVNASNVNIDGTSGTTKLDIRGNDASFVGADIVIRRASTSEGVGRGAVIQMENAGGLNAHIIQGSDAGIQFFNGGAATGTWNEHMRITANGNVGIGTTSPVFKLHVNGEAGFSGALYTSNAEGLRVTNQNGYISGWDNTNNVRTGFLQFNYGNSVVLNAENGTFLSFNTGIFERMRIKSNGNVGIGTTNPMEYKLAVEGTVGARKMKVTQETWADYVFDSSYQLAPLTHVEKFIQENKHLPEVPSAAEVKKDGLDLGDNQAVLLKKIEELTLYIIQQNKRIDQMEKRMAEMEAK